MELSHIKTFIQIARSGSMTKASLELHRTQPALSAQLAKLEEELGEELFDRTPRGMLLTDAGEVFLSYAEQAIGRLDDGLNALTKFRGLEHGSLAIGGGVTATTYLLPKPLGDFRKIYPNISLFVHENASSNVVEDLLRGNIDLGIVTLPSSVTNNRFVHVEPWIEDELKLLVPKSHPLYKRSTFRWEQLNRVPLVLFEAGSTLRSQIDARMSEANVAANVVMELRSIEAIKRMVHEGIGAAFVSQHCLDSDSLNPLSCEEGPIRRTLGLVYRTDLTLNPSARAFLDLIFDKRYH